MAAQGQFISTPDGSLAADNKSHGQSHGSLAEAGTDDVESQQDMKSWQTGGSSLRRRKGSTVDGETEEEPELEAQRHGTWKSATAHVITAVM